MKIDKPKYKDYTASTKWGEIFDDYPILEEIKDKAKENETTFTIELNKYLGKDTFDGQQQLSPELIGDIVEALGV